MNCLSNAPYSQLLQQSRYKGSIIGYTSEIPAIDLQHLITLLQFLTNLPYLSSKNPSIQRWGSELLISFCTNFMFFLLEPIQL